MLVASVSKALVKDWLIRQRPLSLLREALKDITIRGGKRTNEHVIVANYRTAGSAFRRR